MKEDSSLILIVMDLTRLPRRHGKTSMVAKASQLSFITSIFDGRRDQDHIEELGKTKGKDGCLANSGEN